jgi:hypothetical protein
VKPCGATAVFIAWNAAALKNSQQIEHLEIHQPPAEREVYFRSGFYMQKSLSHN